MISRPYISRGQASLAILITPLPLQSLPLSTVFHLILSFVPLLSITTVVGNCGILNIIHLLTLLQTHPPPSVGNPITMKSLQWLAVSTTLIAATAAGPILVGRQTPAPTINFKPGTVLERPHFGQRVRPPVAYNAVKCTQKITDQNTDYAENWYESGAHSAWDYATKKISQAGNPNSLSFPERMSNVFHGRPDLTCGALGFGGCVDAFQCNQLNVTAG